MGHNGLDTIWIFVTFTLIISTLVESGTSPISKRSLMSSYNNGGVAGEREQRLSPFKRTFCNAFTGCGRKRSEGGVAPGAGRDYEYQSDDPNTGPNLDDSLDDLARDILAESRLWEAFQARNFRVPSQSLPQQKQQGRQGFYGRQKRSAFPREGSLPEGKEEEDVVGATPEENSRVLKI